MIDAQYLILLDQQINLSTAKYQGYNKKDLQYHMDKAPTITTMMAAHQLKEKKNKTHDKSVRCISCNQAHHQCGNLMCLHCVKYSKVKTNKTS